MTNPSAVRFYTPDHPALTNTVRARLKKRRDELSTQLLSSQDWPNFTERRGVIAGLDEAIAICEQASKEFDRA